ncbi:MAG: DUF1501 domain-containing protein [Planctomycetota bacterium]|nr:DUF1501 domain-containing protein [Planctomycetota bacterium]
MDRRNFLWQSGGGLGGIALSALLAESGFARQPMGGSGDEPLGADDQLGEGAALQTMHHAPRAKRVVQLFMSGAASHLDMWDHKPFLEKHHGQKSDFGEKVELFQNGHGPWMKSPWKFRPYGECGKMLSEVVSPLGRHADEMAFVHNLVGKTGVHSQATYLQATGFQRPGFPGVGAWVSYALGTLNENLPSFVVMPDKRGYASNGPKNWHSAFLPAQHQGTVVRPSSRNPIPDLFPTNGKYITRQASSDAIELLGKLNRRHMEQRRGDSRLEARIKSYELAAGMQLKAPEVFDFSGEPKHVLKLYGLDHGKSEFSKEINPLEETDLFGRKCLAARRMLERGVRFIQIWSGNDNSFPRRNWDSHENIQRDHGPLATGMAHGASALIEDLKQRDMLKDTLVMWTTEFGRMPSSQGGTGRDHNPFVFTNWFCGGGIRGGTTHGPSDQWGFKPLDRDHPTEVYDIHATLLHLLGIDHEKLTVPHNGIQRRLTDVHGHVINELLA